MVTTAAEAPLTGYRVVGVRENWYQAAPGAPRQPGGGCWHCGTGIAIEVVIRSVTSGEEHTIGTTCAEREGLSGPALKAMLAARYAEERAQRASQRSAEERRAQAEREAALAAAHGPHGTESRFLAGCFCVECVAAAPHGTTSRFLHGACRCLQCIEAVLVEMPGDFRIQPERTALVDLTTGEVADARVVAGRYGRSWCVGDGAAWVPVAPARRRTQASRGYVEAEVPYLVEVCGRLRDQWLKPIVPLGLPLVDRWGEPIPRSSRAAG